MAADPAGAQCSPSWRRGKTWKPFEALLSLGRGSRRESREQRDVGAGLGFRLERLTFPRRESLLP